MLSAAHILAMNAKNLLDVIDSIRIKHPRVNVVFGGPNWVEMDPSATLPEANYRVTS